MERFVCIHGHFYQPPRENPRLGTIEPQQSAHPYHDWNERIAAECYAPNAAASIMNGDDPIAQGFNNYSRISFNFGPTLLSWMEQRKPNVYHAILQADRLSRERFSGHGSALAQVYNHMILPLANRRDKQTQILWGIKDFEKRFRRSPEGMWLPETAVDVESLELLAELGIKFTILCPCQVSRVKEIGWSDWVDVSGGRVDPTMAYLCYLPSGRSINLFVYNGLISADLAFGTLLDDGEIFAQRLLEGFRNGAGRPQLVHVATDGETYGHHRRHGVTALARCLRSIESGPLAKLTNYSEHLERCPPTHAVEIVENSSWSCAHGIERWRDDCGCQTGMNPGWSQAWRKPLREAMDWLGEQLASLYQAEAGRYFDDPWKARDGYIEIILKPAPKNIARFLQRNTCRRLSDSENERALKLLDMERYAMLLYTSCGWFFDEISGIESIQVMRYAARAMELAHEVKGIALEPEYIRMLERAPSNRYKNGARVYEEWVKNATPHVRTDEA